MPRDKNPLPWWSRLVTSFDGTNYMPTSWGALGIILLIIVGGVALLSLF